MWDLRFSQQGVSVFCLLEWDVIYQNMRILPPPHTKILSFQENGCAEVVLLLYAIIKQSPKFSYDDDGDDRKKLAVFR